MSSAYRIHDSAETTKHAYHPAQAIGTTVADYVAENWFSISVGFLQPYTAKKLDDSRWDLERLMGAMAWVEKSGLPRGNDPHALKAVAKLEQMVKLGSFHLSQAKQRPLDAFEPIAGVAGVVAQQAFACARDIESGRPTLGREVHTLEAAGIMAAIGGGSADLLDAVKALQKAMAPAHDLKVVQKKPRAPAP